ncbi:MAG: thymidine phosphorylase [Deltaproteobacteria bacterium]|nr:thymidine phosphorylase [Deltaproteobacteria bacterium]
MQAKELIRKKREGLEHNPKELATLVDTFLKGELKDYQMAAWLMAVFFKGLSAAEMHTLLQLMWKSGSTLPRRHRNDYWIDKHSTGGQGDKTSIILVPLVTAVLRRLFGPHCARIPMVSGRGLGRTGGTLDKLESVPGFRTDLTLDEAMALLENNDFFMMAQTADFVPADRLLYSLRDATATVDSIPLMACSILSKKLAENVDGLVLDAKLGCGAHLANPEDGRKVARLLVDLARGAGVDTVAIFSRMDEPLGYKVGNHLELEECADFLSGTRRERGLREVVLNLAGLMVMLASRRKLSLQEAIVECEKELEECVCMDVFRQMFESQGGNWHLFEQNRGILRSEMKFYVAKSPYPGYLQSINASEVGQLINELGGGRNAKEDSIDPFVGIEFERKVGDRIEKGQSIATVYYRKLEQEKLIEHRLTNAFTISSSAIAQSPWVLGMVE